MDFLPTSKRKSGTGRKALSLIAVWLVSSTVASYAVHPPRPLLLRVEPQKRARSQLDPTSVTLEATASTAETSPLPTSATFPITDPTTTDKHWTFPLPFDTVLGTNFTTNTCPGYFSTFLNSPSFQACRPLSLLLGTSNGFFTAQKNPTTILPYVIDQTCSVSSSCTGTMAAYAQRFQEQDVCGQDLDKGNALATTALAGFLNYPLYLELGCQKNDATENYCFTEAAAAGAGNASDMYWYFLGQGTSLPSGTQASCSSCQSQLMTTYSKYAVNRTLQISETYKAARTLANNECGPNFAPLIDGTSAAQSLHLSGHSLLFVLGAFFLLYCF